MAEHAAHLQMARRAKKVAWLALAGGAMIMGLKFAVFALTNSAAVLSDAMESIVNLAAAAVAALSTWYAAQPPDRLHPYGHGKVEFVAVGIEGAMIVLAGAVIVFEASRRLAVGAEVRNLDTGSWMLVGIAVLLGLLATCVYLGGRRLQSPTLIADGKHLLTDVLTTAGVVVGLILVQFTGKTWLDPVIAIAVAGTIFYTGGRLLVESWGGLVDQIDIADDRLIRAVLDDEVAAGRILAYHEVRHRHVGAFHWVDLHIQLEGDMAVHQAHEIASHVERRIERQLGRAKATAHVEPPENITPAT
ncbi:MAG: cation transporter [Candidatus Rokubacteria bacterium]|nr:cation transporter [Candidatus Rokubacteria bacterium]